MNVKRDSVMRENVMREDMKICIGVIGGSQCSDEVYELAREVGREIARREALLVCGGLTGVMEAACRGAKEGGGTTVGILPGTSREAANPHVDVRIATGLGHARNAIIAQTADALIAIDGSYGTLSEVALGLIHGKPVVGLRFSFNVEGVQHVDTPLEAVTLTVELLNR